MKNLKDNCSYLGKLQPSATLVISAKAKEMKAKGADVCSMTAGEPDFDTPQVIKDACIQAINDGKVGYIASSGLPELKKEIVKKFAADGITTAPENIIVTTGAKFAVFQAINCLCGEGDEVILFAPYWLSYSEMIKASGARAVVIQTKPENDFAPKPEDIERVVTDRTKLIIINSPNNPTGAVYSRETLQMIADIAVKHNIMVLSDEIYEKLIYDAGIKHYSIASLNDQIAELTITINGFSKAYAMTGWRLGYLTAPTWLSKRISALQSHATSNATSFVQYAAVCALQGKADDRVEYMVSEFGKRRDLLCSLLNNLPLISFYVPKGAFYVICNISQTGMNADEFALALLDKENLAVIPCTTFGNPECIRLSYACSEQNIKDAVTRLKKFLENYS